MTGGSIISIVGSLLCLLGPILLPFITVDEEEVAFASFEIMSGQISLALSIASLILGGLVWKKRKQSMGWLVSIIGLAQIGLMAATYAYVWQLVPCSAAELSLCDEATGGLIDQTLVTLDWGLVLVVLGSITAVFGGLIVVAAHPEYLKGQRFLRVIMSWDGTIIYEKVLYERQAVTVGEGNNNTFQVAASGLDQHTMFAPVSGDDTAYTLNVPNGAKGTVKIGGDEKDAGGVSSAQVTKGDAGVFHFENDVDIAFKFTGAETAILAGAGNRSAAMFISFFSVALVMLFFVLAMLLTRKEMERDTISEELAAKQKELIEVTLEQEEIEEEEEEPEGEEEDTTAKKAGGEEGKFGDADTDPNKKSKVPKMDGPMRDKIDVKNIGINKIIGGQQALDGALGDIMAGDTGALSSKMAVAMSGEGSELVIGHGSGGMGFRGTGSGGGGDGYGRIHGLGAIDTGGGTGRRANVGLGRKKKKRVAKLKIATGQSSGGCDKGDIKKNVRRRAAAIRACYEKKLLTKPDLQGKLVVMWTIKEDGRAANTKLASDTIKDSSVTDCVLRVMGRLRFKKPDAGVCVIRWPFVFRPG